MPDTTKENLYTSLTKAIAYAAGIVILLWFFYKISGVILLLLLAIVMAILINGPITSLEKRNIKRGWASLIVFSAIAVVLGLMAWLIIPKISSELTNMINNLPAYIEQLSANISSWFEDYPELNKELQQGSNSLLNWLPSLPSTLMQVGNYSLSIIAGILILLVFVSMVIYMVVQPRPMAELYISFFPLSQRDKATRAIEKISVMLNGWIRSNIIGGAIQSVLVVIFLKLMNVPGAWVWGGIAFFAMLIPKMGFYIMAILPTLVALAQSPVKALWVVIFFIAMDEIMGDFIMPKLRSNTMKIHPTSILFILLAMTSAFGLIGAIMATPLAAIIKGYYEEFYLTHHNEDKQLEQRINKIIYRTGEKPGNQTS